MRSHHKETVHTLRQCSSFSCIFSPHVTSNRMNLYVDLFLGLSPPWVTKQSTLSWEAWCATVPLKAYPVTRLTRKCDLRHICLLLVKWELLLSCLLFVLDINCRVRTLDVTRSAQWPEVQGFTKKNPSTYHTELSYPLAPKAFSNGDSYWAKSMTIVMQMSHIQQQALEFSLLRRAKWSHERHAFTNVQLMCIFLSVKWLIVWSLQYNTNMSRLHNECGSLNDW